MMDEVELRELVVSLSKNVAAVCFYYKEMNRRMKDLIRDVQQIRESCGLNEKGEEK